MESLLGLKPMLIPNVPDLIGDEPRLSFRPLRDSESGGPRRISWRMPDGVVVPALYLRPRGTAKGAILAVADEGKESLLDHPALREAYDAGWAVVLADLRGMGELAITKPGWVYAISLLLGENFAGRQAMDLIAGVRGLRAEPSLRGKPVGILAHGAFAAFAGLYASHLEPSISWLAAERGYSSVRVFLDRPRSELRSYALAAVDREREVLLDREMPHALIPFGVLRRAKEFASLMEDPKRIVWAAAVDGDGDPVPGPDSVLPFIRARLEEPR
jgi:hypothetical protein